MIELLCLRQTHMIPTEITIVIDVGLIRVGMLSAFSAVYTFCQIVVKVKLVDSP